MSSRWLRLSAVGPALVALGACVTINVYFPAAAAEKAADRIIEDVWGPDKSAPPAAPKPAPTSGLSAARLLVAVLDVLIAPAAAQQPPAADIDVSSPEISRIKSQMENRFVELKPLFVSGAVGLTSDGFVETRDANLVPLAQRNQVRTMVANENSDRAALYREIAVANGQPGWEADIRGVFAQRWIAKAQAGWWYRDALGGWKQR